MTQPHRCYPHPKDIKRLFPSATGVGIMLPTIGQGLAIGFNTRADLGSELKLAEPSPILKHDVLFELTKTFGFVVLKNCSALNLPEDERSKLSRGKDSDGRFSQDPFHYDMSPPERPDLPAGYMTGLYQKSAKGREEDTLYAREGDVKAAIAKLDHASLNDEVQDALSEMMKPDYHFRLFNPHETQARKIVQQQYPEFVEDVFALIPKGHKYRQRWLKDQWEIFIFSNVFGDGLHARPTGHVMGWTEIPSNPLSSFYLVKN